MDFETSLSSFSIEALHSLISKYNHESMLCSSFDINSTFSEDWKFDYSLCTESCLSRRNLYTIVEICSLPSESSFILRNGKSNIEISISIISFISFSTKFDGHTILNSLWNIDGLFDLFSYFSARMTIGTLFGDLLSFTMTSSTWTSLLHNPKYSLNSFSNLSLSMTRMTLFSFSSFTTTMVTSS